MSNSARKLDLTRRKDIKDYHISIEEFHQSFYGQSQNVYGDSPDVMQPALRQLITTILDRGYIDGFYSFALEMTEDNPNYEVEEICVLGFFKDHFPEHFAIWFDVPFRIEALSTLKVNEALGRDIVTLLTKFSKEALDAFSDFDTYQEPYLLTTFKSLLSTTRDIMQKGCELRSNLKI